MEEASVPVVSAAPRQKPVLLKSPYTLHTALSERVKPGKLLHVKLPKALRRDPFTKSFAIVLCLGTEKLTTETTKRLGWSIGVQPGDGDTWVVYTLAKGKAFALVYATVQKKTKRGKTINIWVTSMRKVMTREEVQYVNRHAIPDTMIARDFTLFA